MLIRRHLLKTVLLMPFVARTASAQTLTASPWDAEPAGDAPLQPFFLPRSKVWQGIDIEADASPFDFGLQEEQIIRAIDRVVTAAHAPQLALDRLEAREARVIGERVADAVNMTMKDLGLAEANNLTRQWLLAEGVCAWVQRAVRFDHRFTGDWDRLSANEIRQWTESKFILQRPQPATVCWGIAVTVRDIARVAGLRCDFTNGTLRWLGAPSPPPGSRNHGVVTFIFDGGNGASIEVPADVSSQICTYQNNNRPFQNRKIDAFHVLPRHAAAWELFLALFNSDVGPGLTISGDRQNLHRYLDMDYRQWANRNTKYLNPLLETYREWEMQRAI